MLAKAGPELLPGDLPFIGGPIPLPDEPVASARPKPVGPYHAAREHALARFQKQYLAALLDQTEGNMSRAAEIAGVERSTLYRMLEKHGMQRSIDLPIEPVIETA